LKLRTSPYASRAQDPALIFVHSNFVQCLSPLGLF
jgi:hypothetical protein